MLWWLQNLQKEKIYQHLHGYISLWVVPNGGKLHEVFNEHRAASNRRSKSFKCQASEGLGLYPIISAFLITTVLPADICVAECRCYLALANLIDLVMGTATLAIDPNDLRDAVTQFLQLCIEAGWRQHMHPKFHWLVHLPHHLDRFGFLPTCWVHERKHKLVKRYSNDIRNTITFEKSVLTQILCHELHSLQQPGMLEVSECMLANRSQAPKSMIAFLSECLQVQLSVDNCFTSSVARLKPAGNCAKGDVVLLSNNSLAQPFQAGQVWFHSECEGTCFSLVSLWHFSSYDADNCSAMFLKVDNPVLIPTSEILQPVTHICLKENSVRVLVPLAHR
jgi:hypothetical protein